MKPVTIYTTITCPYCKKAKAYFQEKGIRFTEKDVTEDPRAQEEMIKKSGMLAVPVIDIGGTIIVGFDKEAIEKALAA